MTDKKNGGPAFPIPGLQTDPRFNGMTLRDWFAGQALLAIIPENIDLYKIDGAVVRRFDFANVAYAMSDAMLEVRELEDREK